MKENPRIDLLRSARFRNQGDRGTALLASAWVDDALATLIKSNLLPEQKMLEEVFHPEGALGTFGSRIKVAYLLRLIDGPTKQDLDLIRKIRNEFAHNREDVRFTGQEVKARCKELKVAVAFENGATPMRSCREKFLISCYFLAEIFLKQSSQKKKKVQDLFPNTLLAYVRHRAKRFNIQRMLEAVGYDFEKDPAGLGA